ncbi:MAG: transketolase family protein [Aminivibrio sp.]|jgi:transketolase|nr:transketolase [Synergistaceae bacterium]
MTGAGRSTEDAYGPALMEFAASGGELTVVEGGEGSDAGSALFREAWPGKVFNLGAAEQDMILTAAGLALGGKNVCVSSNSSFLVGRGYEQIRSAIAIPGLPVKIAGTRCGVTVGEDGASRQMLEDLALMRAFPNMAILAPADYASAMAALTNAFSFNGPVYIRLGRGAAPQIYEDGDKNFRPGGGRSLREGSEVTLCCCGIMVAEALKAAEVLAKQGIGAEVIDCYSVAPLPSQLILDSVHRTGCCVVAEEHFARGGLGEGVAALVSAAYPVPVKQVAIFDKFGQSGSPAELQEYYGLTASQIVSAAASAWTMRRR